MSLAQRVERPAFTAAEPVQTGVLTLKAATPVDFRDITRRPATQMVAVVKPEPAPTRKHSNIAFDLLDELAKAVPAILERCTKLEAELAETRKEARSEIATANDVAREWQQIAGALKLQVEGLEKGLNAMKERADAAEQQIVTLRETADRTQHAAAEAECLSSLFQEKVLSTFGAGSALHPLIESFRARPATQG